MVLIRNQIVKNQSTYCSLQGTFVYLALVCIGQYMKDDSFEGFYLSHFRDHSKLY